MTIHLHVGVSADQASALAEMLPENTSLESGDSWETWGEPADDDIVHAVISYSGDVGLPWILFDLGYLAEHLTLTPSARGTLAVITPADDWADALYTLVAKTA